MKKVKMKILIAMDNSKYSNFAFDWYVENLQNPSDYVILIHCVDFSVLTMPDDVGVSGQLEHCIDKERKSADIFLESLAERLRDFKVAGKVKRCAGSAKEEIVRVADAEKVDMIIVGSRGRGKLRQRQ